MACRARVASGGDIDGATSAGMKEECAEMEMEMYRMCVYAWMHGYMKGRGVVVMRMADECRW